MSNHYHLCVETPVANLVAGMKWLQATFSLRFNRLRNERGHVFQGRYRALPVAPESVGAVCHYIHLNPVRAGVRTLANVADWPWSSLAWLMAPKVRRSWFSPEACLAHAGGLQDTAGDRRRYLAYLGWLQEDDEGKKLLLFDQMSRGWAVGERDFKESLLRASGDGETRFMPDPKLAGVLWEERVQACLRAARKTELNVRDDPKGSPWKVAIAAVLKASTTASNPWIARRLNMGSPFRVSRLTAACRANPETTRFSES